MLISIPSDSNSCESPTVAVYLQICIKTDNSMATGILPSSSRKLKRTKGLLMNKCRLRQQLSVLD